MWYYKNKIESQEHTPVEVTAPMSHTVSFIRDNKDPSVLYPILVNVGPLDVKVRGEEPDTNRLPLGKDRTIVTVPPSALSQWEETAHTCLHPKPIPGADTRR